MNNKNEGYKRTFVPKTIGESLSKINKNISNKYGKTEYLILLKWSEIVGSFFSNHSEPEKISRIPDQYNEIGEQIFKNLLIVKVAPAAALEFEHFKDKIIEKINSYFGYKAVSGIKINQNFTKSNNSKIPEDSKVKTKKSIHKNIIKKDINNFKDKNLEESIIKLGITINKEGEG